MTATSLKMNIAEKSNVLRCFQACGLTYFFCFVLGSLGIKIREFTRKIPFQKSRAQITLANCHFVIFFIFQYMYNIVLKSNFPFILCL